jgi:hypothetical protein
MPRPYKKRSDYWKKFDADGNKKPLESLYEMHGSKEWSPSFEGEPYYFAQAGYSRSSGSGGSTSYRQNAAASQPILNRFANIAEGMLPYNYRDQGYVDIQDAIQLCQKAYANIAIFRNTIDVMSEFSNSNIYLQGGNDKVRKFIYKWLEKIKCWEIKDQYFREYYRSGNVFIYRIDGKYSTADIQKMQTVYGATGEYIESGKIPIMYTFLNPFDIIAKRALTFSKKGGRYGNYAKLLSEYELESLRDPKTDYDKEVFDALDEITKKRIRDGSFTSQGVTVLLDAKRLIYSFYKKQDYEPFAMPFGFPVLDDLNWKIELKKIDQAIVQTVENVILLITMGSEPEKGGINPHNLTAMQNLFRNESVGRVLVSDYTTKADFVMPDLNKVLGSEKYKVVNEDIREGLQNIIVGNEKYKNTEVKARIFLERLKESRQAFLNDFLQPQIKLVCQSLGFRDYPIASFEDIDLKDETQFQRVTTRLMELGILTPDQGIRAIESGVFPNKDDLAAAQKTYVDDREKGYYNPLVGGVPMVSPAIDEAGPPLLNQTPESPGRPGGTKEIEQTEASTKTYSRKGVQGIVYKIEELRKFLSKEAKAHLNIKRMSQQKKQLVDSLCENVVIASETKDWEKKGKECIIDFSNIESLSVLPEINQIAAEHQIKLYEASLLYHSNK